MTEGRKELFGELRAKRAELLRWHFHRCYNSIVGEGLTDGNVADAMYISAELTKVNYEMDWGRKLEDGKAGVEQISESFHFLAQCNPRDLNYMNRYRLDSVLKEYQDWLGEQLRIRCNGTWIMLDGEPCVKIGDSTCCPISAFEHYFLDGEILPNTRPRALQYWEDKIRYYEQPQKETK